MQEETVRVFTVEEANAVLPEISRQLEEIHIIGDRSRSLKLDMDNLMGIWGKEVLDAGHVDNEFYSDRSALWQKAQSDLAERIEAVHKLGCIVKDAENGLVDFYCERNGTLVFLCWKQGEKQVSHWHPIDGGFASRQPIR